MRLTDPAIPIHRITTGFFASPLPCASGPVDGPASCSVFDMLPSLLVYVLSTVTCSSLQLLKSRIPPPPPPHSLYQAGLADNKVSRG
jgi:hypothetical protein